ncbi:hypothetical protein T265_10605 [Opisthorchis viverrini]|uniref:Uncharacterized protein n=1 Tax=Opisthorchis viverrini TaxID=6198 RepID=A0A074Z1U1_OPIVI|nr:hypothetical protein T265_10605 [Opisthorchis viverrini]KER20948.1 hypothetical protein T265_10605 [Opisthorchis viverrini]
MASVPLCQEIRSYHKYMHMDKKHPIAHVITEPGFIHSTTEIPSPRFTKPKVCLSNALLHTFLTVSALAQATCFVGRLWSSVVLRLFDILDSQLQLDHDVILGVSTNLSELRSETSAMGGVPVVPERWRLYEHTMMQCNRRTLPKDAPNTMRCFHHSRLLPDPRREMPRNSNHCDLCNNEELHLPHILPGRGKTRLAEQLCHFKQANGEQPPEQAGRG